jgi:hypothetical protein
MRTATLTVKKAKELALNALCKKLQSGIGGIVTLSTRDFCRNSNPKPCGEALKALCIELGNCRKVSKRKYAFERSAVINLNICGNKLRHA